MSETANLFRSLSTASMNAAEIAVYHLKLERDALTRRQTKYHWALRHILSFFEPGPEQDRRLQRLNETYPLGYCRPELVKINAAIERATIDLHRQRAANLKQGEHFNTRRTNLGR
jgi:hypothetical protein